MTVWIDTHCHLDASEFDADRDLVRDRARAAGVAQCVLPAVHPENFGVVRDLAARHSDAYALGIHPLFTPRVSQADLECVDEALAAHHADDRLVAVGEIGLDYFVPGLDAQWQEHVYREQLVLARRHALPVIVHVRRSADRLLKHLREQPCTGIAHAFNGSFQQAMAFVELGFKLGFGGAVTFDRALQLRRLAARLPLEAIVLETDSPDIPPHWLYRTAQERSQGGPQGRNEPAQLPRIAQAIAQLRGIPVDELAAATTRNALESLPRLAKIMPAL